MNVSWNDAVAFCEWAQKRARQQTGDERMEIRLPSEAEWEYAARAGSQTWYYFGNDEEELAEYENVSDGTLKEYEPLREVSKRWRAIKSKDGHVFTCPVSAGKGNKFGLKHMLGNVCEWTGDWYSKNLYKERLPGSSAGPERGTARVIRGGSWGGSAGDCRSAGRRRIGPLFRSSGLGFRLAGTVGQ